MKNFANVEQKGCASFTPLTLTKQKLRLFWTCPPTRTTLSSDSSISITAGSSHIQTRIKYQFESVEKWGSKLKSFKNGTTKQPWKVQLFYSKIPPYLRLQSKLFLMIFGTSLETNSYAEIFLLLWVFDFSIFNCRNLFRGKEIAEANLVRYRIPKAEVLKRDVVEPYTLPLMGKDGGGHDFEVLGYMEGPVYNYPMVNGKDYTYCYGITGFCMQAKLAKLNVKTKECITWGAGSGDVLPTFPSFFPRPGATEEDDGVLVSACTGANGEKSFLLVLDARNMEEVCRANMPVNMGMALHGNFFPT